MSDVWLLTKDGDPAAFQIMQRHYSFNEFADGRRKRMNYPQRFLFVGPGQKMVLVTADYSALFVWRKFIDDSGQSGVNCAVFRNEGNQLSSALILAAEQRAWERWPGERLYTYVDSSQVKSTNPGFCFIQAGWTKCGVCKVTKIIFEKYPAGKEMNAPSQHRRVSG